MNTVVTHSLSGSRRISTLTRPETSPQVISNIVSVLDSYNNPNAAIADFVEAFEHEAFDTRHIASSQPMVSAS